MNCFHEFLIGSRENKLLVPNTARVKLVLLYDDDHPIVIAAFLIYLGETC